MDRSDEALAGATGDDGRMSLRPAVPGDRFRLSGWLRLPHVVQSWGPPASSAARIAIALDSPSALCRVVIVDGVPIGWAHAMDVIVAGGSTIEGVPVGTYEVDLFIGVPEYLGRGLAPRIVTSLVDEVFATTLAPACCGFLPIAEERGVRLYERAGFRWVGIDHRVGPAPAWVMVRDRPTP